MRFLRKSHVHSVIYYYITNDCKWVRRFAHIKVLPLYIRYISARYPLDVRSGSGKAHRGMWFEGGDDKKVCRRLWWYRRGCQRVEAVVLEDILVTIF